MTYGTLLRFVPTAMQVVSRGQTIADKRSPCGIEDVGVQVVKSFVLRLVAPPPLAIPMASHVFDPAHDTADKRFTKGWSSVVHGDPFWVPIMEGRESITPTATQVSEVGQETLLKVFNPAGGVSGLQVAPLAVSSMPRPPTAVHSSIVKQEIDWAGNDES